MKVFSPNAGCVWLSILAAAVDQAIKTGIRHAPERSILFTCPGLFEITHYTNTGAAFSLFRGRTLLLAIVSSGIILTLLGFLVKRLHLTRGAQITLSFLIGGGIGNLIDRMFFGGVTDYFRLLIIPFPVFNLADVFVTLSALVLSIYILTGRLDYHPEKQ